MIGREHYRHTSNIVRVGPLDARSIAPFVVLLFWKSWTPVILGCITVGFFWAIETKGLTLDNFMRRLRVSIGGKYKPVSTSLTRYLRS
jgi:hypothetical protein